MKKSTLLLSFLIFHFSFLSHVNAQIIQTFAGNGVSGYTGDGGQATSAENSNNMGIFYYDSNVYIPDVVDEVVRKVKKSTGIITTFAGKGIAGYTGNGGAATLAELSSPKAISVDAAGNIYIAEGANCVIRVVNHSTGIISLYGGNHISGYSGDGGSATSAELDDPEGLAMDAAGNLYVTDRGNEIVRKITTSGIITTIAGIGGVSAYYGDGGQATAAEMVEPFKLAIDTSTNNLFIADEGNARIRKVVISSGIISTFAGTGTNGFSGDGGQATSAKLDGPTDVALDGKGNIFIADWQNERIRTINSSGIISTIAGTGSSGYTGDGGEATSAKLDLPVALTIDGDGDIEIACTDEVRIVYRYLVVTATVTANETCNASTDGSASVSASEGVAPYTYSWAPGGATTSSVSGLSAGTFTAYVTDKEGITGSAAVTITKPAALSVSGSVSANVLCYGESNGSVSASVSGGVSPYTYSWAPGGNTTTTETGLSAGTYTIYIEDNNGCTANASTTVTQPATALSVSASAKTSTVCPGNSDSLFSTPSGGTSPYTFSWTPDQYSDLTCSTCQKTNSYPFGTTYTITITDAHGCTVTASPGITVLPFPYVTITGSANPCIAGNNDTLVASGILATSYLWSTGATTSSIIVAPSVQTTYSIKATNMFGCYDSNHYTIDTDQVGNGNTSSSPIRIVPGATCNMGSYSTNDSVEWFSFVQSDSNTQIVAISDFLGMPVPHVHRLTLYNSSLQIIHDEHLPDINGANELRIDASKLIPGTLYYIRAARTPAHGNTPGCNPTPTPTGVCNESAKWSFGLCVRTIHVFIPNDSGAEAPAMNQLYYECSGQIEDLNNIPRFGIRAYTNFASPAIYCTDSAINFVVSKRCVIDTANDSIQRVAMSPYGSAAQTPERMFKTGLDSGAGYLNYFLGFVPNGITSVYGYNRVVYKNVFPNIDMHLYSNTAGTKLYFVCNPGGGGAGGGNPANIELQFKGATSEYVSSGSLYITTAFDTISFAPGFAYTDSAGIVKPKSWQAYFIQVSPNVVKFNTGTYNTAEPLVIQVDRGHRVNSILSNGNINWCTYYGGTATSLSAQGIFFDVITDASDNVYTCGLTGCSDFPYTTGAFQTILNGTNNTVVAKFGSTYNQVWATYYGGSDIDQAYSIGVDGSENVYITGETNSPNFPMPATQPPGAFVQAGGLNGTGTGPDYDAFIVKLNSSGTAPIWATFYGGSGESEVANHLTLDGLGNLYIVGGGIAPTTVTTFSTYPSTASGTPYNNSTYGTAFILEFTTAGVQEWATRIGGSNGSSATEDELNGCTVDGSNNFFVTGVASESGYPPPVSSSLIFPINGSENAVATKFDVNNNIVWSTYYGGNELEIGNAITTDASGDAYITGISYSSYAYSGLGIQIAHRPWPAWHQDDNGIPSLSYTMGNGFIAEFNSSGTGTPLIWGSYFGGIYNLDVKAIIIDANNNLFITGYEGYRPAGDLPFPITEAANTYTLTTPTQPGDGFIAGFNNAQYVWGTYFGGTGDGNGLAEYSSSKLYLVGTTGKQNPPFPGVNPGGGAWYTPSLPSSNGSGYIAEMSVAPITIASTYSISNTENIISIYPNPTAENIMVNITLIKSEDLKFELNDILGQKLFCEDLLNQTGTINRKIDLSLLANGIYILKTEAGNNIYVNKIIKQK